MIPRVDVLGVRISVVNPQSALSEISSWVSHSVRTYVCVTGVHGVMESQRDPQLMQIHNESGLTTPDGMPMVWAGKRVGAVGMERVYGPDLMLSVFERSEQDGWTHFLYGGRPEVLELLALRLAERYPNARVVGTFSPPFRPLVAVEVDEVVSLIERASPTFVWVGLNTPKQERWMHQFRPLLSATALFGVGAAFDINAGLLRNASGFIQRAGLQWAFRLALEPRRLWRRYLNIIPRYLWRIWRNPPRLIERRT